MADITLKGNACHTSGDLPAVGTKAPDFTLVAGDLSEKTLADFSGKTLLLNIVPSLDTPTCATSAKAFNEKATAADIVVVNVSRDLPFAQKRFCAAENIENVESLSAFRCSGFGDNYGMTIVDGPLKGLLGRAIVVVNGAGEVVYSQLVGEIADEPDYDAALSCVAAG